MARLLFFSSGNLCSSELICGLFLGLLVVEGFKNPQIEPDFHRFFWRDPEAFDGVECSATITPMSVPRSVDGGEKKNGRDGQW